MYPAFEKYITNGGKEMADKDRVEHSEVPYLTYLPDYCATHRNLTPTAQNPVKEIPKLESD